MSLSDKFLALPLAHKFASILAIFCFVTGVVLAIASQQGQAQLISQSTELFGESLVAQLSREASTPLVQGDRLSLQALLNKLAESPLVERAAVYDLENRPIAEAGKPEAGKDLSASITFQDSIAGYAVVTFNTEPLRQQAGHQRWQLLALALLLAALAYVLALYPGRQLTAAINDLRLIAGTPAKRRKTSLQIAYRGDDELRDLSRAILDGPPETNHQAPPLDYAVLIFEITNLPSLQINLGQQSLANALHALREQTITLCRLYDGELQVCRSHGFAIIFSDEDADNSYPFRALCAAILIEQSLNASDLPFNFRQAIVTNDIALSRLEPATGQQRIIEQGLSLATVSREGILISDNVFYHDSVHHRIHASKLEDGALCVEYLNQPYQQLLERQLQTLRQA